MHDLDMRALAIVYGGPRGEWARTMLAFTFLGSGWVTLVLLPLIGWSRTRPFARTLAVGVVAQATWVWTLKQLVGRVRPWIALGLPPPYGSPHDASFPSGHASGSFCVAVFLAVALPAAWPESAWRARLVAGVALLAASLIALSRVYLGAHFPSDVIAGGLMGGAFGAGAGSLYMAVERTPKRG